MLISQRGLLASCSRSTSPRTPTPSPRSSLASGLEVEALHRHGAGVAPHDGRPAILVAEIRGKAPHPQAGKLTVVELFDGTTTLTVCCGASNLPPVGGKVAFAPIGAKLPGGLEIAPRELRGVASQGMICSETELDIGADGDGILILPRRVLPAGAPLHSRSCPASIDTVLELNVTPNRPDALGHVGVARDVADQAGRVACACGARWSRDPHAAPAVQREDPGRRGPGHDRRPRALRSLPRLRAHRT
jgi:tRNA-binding EMAP/Myf-like protein